MSYRIKTVFEGYVLDVHVELEGNPINLSYDGSKTWKSTDDINVEGALDLLMICRGLNGTGWKISLTLDGQSKAFYEKEGEIKSKGYSRLIKDITMPKSDKDKAAKSGAGKGKAGKKK